MPTLLGILTLWGSTLGVMAYDRSTRAKRAAAADVTSFAVEPQWSVLLLTTILLNIVALPYYFYATRRTLASGLKGGIAFLACFASMRTVTILAATLGRQ